MDKSRKEMAAWFLNQCSRHLRRCSFLVDILAKSTAGVKNMKYLGAVESIQPRDITAVYSYLDTFQSDWKNECLQLNYISVNKL